MNTFSQWDQAKLTLDRSPEPRIDDMQRVKQYHAGSHGVRGDSHALVQYKLPIVVDCFQGALEWSYCSECKKIQHKLMVIYNNELNLAYRKFIIENGEPAKKHE